MGRRTLLTAIGVTAALLVCSVAALVYTMMRRDSAIPPAALAPDPGLDGLRMPDFALTDQEGRPADAAMFDGRVTVIDFMFTNCPFVCPMMTETMARLSERLAGTRVAFASFSVDPAHDTPERLRQYAAERGLDTTRWRLLTGDQATLERIVRESLQFALHADAATPIPLADGSNMSNIVHPSRLVLIGPDRRVLGMYDYQVPEQMQMLEDRARRAVAALERR